MPRFRTCASSAHLLLLFRRVLPGESQVPGATRFVPCQHCQRMNLLTHGSPGKTPLGAKLNGRQKGEKQRIKYNEVQQRQAASRKSNTSAKNKEPQISSS